MARPPGNLYDTDRTVGSQSGMMRRFLITEKFPKGTKGRFRVHEFGHMENTPDDKLPVAKVGGTPGSPGLQQSEMTPMWVPGTICLGVGSGAQGGDITLISSMTNETEDNQTQHKNVEGKNELKFHSAQQHEDRTYAWSKSIDEIVNAKTREEAYAHMKDSRKGKINSNGHRETRDNHKNAFGERKMPNSGA